MASAGSRIASIKGPAVAIVSGLGAGAAIAVGGVAASPLLTAAAVASAVVTVIVLLYPTLGLILTALVIPIERLGRFSDDLSLPVFSLMRIVGLLALAAVVLHVAARRLPVRVTPPVLAYTVVVLVGALSYVNAADPTATFAETMTMLGNLLFIVLIVNGVRSWWLLQAMLVTWLGASLLIGLYQVYDWHFGSTIIGEFDLGHVDSRFVTTWDSNSEIDSVGMVRRAMGTTSNAAVYGINLIMTLPFLLYYDRVARRPWLNWFLLGCIGLVCYNILLTNTRAVLIVALLAIALCWAARLILITPARLWLGVAGLVAILAVTPDSVWKRTLDWSQYTIEKANNLRARFFLWEGAWKLGSENLWTGIGVGNRTEIMTRVDTTYIEAEWITPHNEYLQNFVEMGLPGVVAVFVFLLTSLSTQVAAAHYFRSQGMREENLVLRASIIVLICVVVFGVQVDVFHFPLKGFWLALGLSCVLYAEARRSSRFSAPAVA
ncbi:MAG: O-antigen ligase family protein [Geminicoccaceae bacterium]